MTREDLLIATGQSSLLFVALWALFRLLPAIPPGAKAWIWRLAFLKPLLALVPFAAITLRVLPSQEASQPPVADTWNFTPLPEAAPILVQPSANAAALQVDPLLAIWIAGVVAAAAYGAWGMRKTLRIAARAHVVERADLLEALGALLQKADVRKEVRLLSSSELHSAMLIGGRGCSIVMPESALERDNFQDLRLMLAHEVAHIARRDLMWFGLASVVQSLYFFNPLVWIAARCSRLDHESATDNYASQIAGVPIRTYAEMLLRATVVARHPQTPGSLPVAESYRTIHRRLKAMKHFNSKPSFWRSTTTAALALLTVALLPAYQFAAAASPAGQAAKGTSIATGTASSGSATMKKTAKAKPAKAVAKPSSSTTFATLPIKVVKGKNGKAKYFVKTTKGYVEIAKPATSPAASSWNYPAGAVAPADVPPRTGGGASGTARNTASVPGFIVDGGGASARPGGMKSPADGALPRSNNAGSAPAAGGAGTRPGGMTDVSIPRSNNAGTGEAGGAAAGNTRPVDTGVRADQTSRDRISSIEFNDEDVKRALIAIFKSLKVSYTISADVKGKITVSLTDVTLEQALQSILKMVDATYRVDGGVYQIVPRTSTNDARSPAG